MVGALLRAIDKLGWSKDETVVVTGIGCSARSNAIIDFNTFQTTHGRALGFATGLKLARPELNVVVITGDGDGAGIGGNHLIHTARRNIDITTILVNNSIYGMTGGQYSPLTPAGAKATTAPFGMVEPNFDVCELVKGAGASFVARSTVFHVRQLEEMISQALTHKGFSFVEVIAQCPTGFGRRNKMRSPAEMMKWQRDHAVSAEAASKLPPEKLEGKFLTGVLHRSDRSEYTEMYQQVIAEASKRGGEQ
jgi:2-oxoglutarate ferredoxin oxidoreductase subunit beta